MNHITKEVGANSRIYLLSDNHQGSSLSDEKGVVETIEKIASERDSYFIHLGDEIEGITVDDKRYSPALFDSISSPPIRQAQDVAARFRPIKDKGIVWLDGNHPLKHWRVGLLTKDIVCKDTGIPWGTWSSIVTLTDRGVPMFRMFVAHGYGSIRSIADDPIRRKANMKLQVKQKLKNKMGDCLVMAMGHTHYRCVVAPEDWLYVATINDRLKQRKFTGDHGEYIHPDHRFYINTGGFQKTYNEDGNFSGYAEILGLDPVQLGYVYMDIRDRQIAEVAEVDV